jgi:xylan 1,4-beta-xylosidase
VLLGLALEAHAQTTVNVSVDATAAGSPLKRVWSFHGYDEANYTTTARGRALLQALATMHTAPVHVRTHFLLNTGDGTASLKWGSTNVYTEDAGGNPVYDFTILDSIQDAIVQSGAFPLNEIAFMPQALSTRPNPYRNSDTYALDAGAFYPPRDYAKWGALIRAWATHVQGRYPGAETSFQWELWNEPDIGYWHGTFDEFARLYDYTEAALHAVFPNASLGGPSVASAGSFFTQFLQHCATGTNAVSGQTGTRLDMVSFHAKGGVAITGGHVQMNLGNQMRLHRTGFSAVSNVAQFRTTPIVISEADPDGCAACPVSSNPQDAYRTSPAYGAYEVAMMKKSLELETRYGVNVRGLLTWAFLFENTPYFAGYRELETNGIHLPVLNAFKLLGRLDGTRLPVTSSGARTLDDILANSVRQQPDIDALATRNGTAIQVLVWNYHDDIVTTAASPVALSVRVPDEFGTRATVTHLRVDETHGDAYTVWTSQGRPAPPSAAQIAALQQAMQPSELEPPRSADVMNGSVSLGFDLPRFGISLVTLTPAGGGMGGMGGAGGAAGTGGMAASAGAGGVAGSVGGAPGSGGSGVSGQGGVPGEAGRGAGGDGTPSGGVGGSESSGGAGRAATAGATSMGGAPSGGAPSGPSSTGNTKSDGGCGCRLPGRHGRTSSTFALVAFGVFALGARRRRAATSL